uniref:Uncharacterized protein n=1 Tax=Arundo donax TaxID=35708 RepID=A0A0A9AB79_ARUDO
MLSLKHILAGVAGGHPAMPVASDRGGGGRGGAGGAALLRGVARARGSA